VFAAAAGVGLAQITSQPSSTDAALSTTAQSASTSHENDFAATSSKENDDLELEQTDSTSEIMSGFASTSAAGPQMSTTGGENQGAGQQKVEVCHMTGNGNSHTINIAAPAVPAHVAHGDTQGACATTPTTTAAAQTPAVVVPTSHGSSTHVTHHSFHGNSGHASHGNSAHSHHGNSGNHGNGHGK
jgi:hypothetical protein